MASEKELKRIRPSMNRGRLSGADMWVKLLFVVVPLTMVSGCGKPCPEGVKRFVKAVELQVIPLDDRDPQWKNGYNIMAFAKMTSGEIIAPIIQVERPRFTGPLGEVRKERVWETGAYFVGEKDSRMFLAADDQIAQYVLLARRLIGVDKKQGPWHVWTIEADAILAGKTRTLSLPPVGTLDLLSNRKDQAELLKKHKAATDYTNYLDK